MKIYFLRHGPAEDRRDWTEDDAGRPLTSLGREQIRRSARMMARLDLAPDAIVTSPLARAHQTASIVAEALGMENKLRSDDRLGHGFSKASLESILKDYAGAQSLMLVGHEPGMSETIEALTGGGRIICKKGSLACVKLTDDRTLQGRLLWLVPPRILAP